MKNNCLISALILLVILFASCAMDTSVTFLNNSGIDIYDMKLEIWHNESPNAKMTTELEQLKMSQSTGAMVFDGDANKFEILYSYIEDEENPIYKTVADNGALKSDERNQIILGTDRVITIHASGSRMPVTP